MYQKKNPVSEFEAWLFNSFDLLAILFSIHVQQIIWKLLMYFTFPNVHLYPFATSGKAERDQIRPSE